MAVTAGTGGTGTVDTNGGTIFSASGASDACTSIQIWCDDASAAAAKVQVTGVHASSNTGCHLAVGKTTVIRFGNQGLKECKAFSATSAAVATIHWGVVAVTGAAPM